MNKFNKTLNINRSSMIRAKLNKAQDCLNYIPRRVSVPEILAKNERATQEDIHLLYVQIVNERNSYRLILEHLNGAVKILEDLKNG